jgi:hypothetical protein
MSQLFDESQQFIDEDTGELLVGGFIYIGANGLDAKLNPITIYPDRELAGIALANPQTIGADGRSTNKIWVAGKYSFKVEDSANVQKYNELENGYDEQVGNTLLVNALGVNDVVANGSPTVTALVDSQTYVFTAPANNTCAMTLKVDATPVMPLKIRYNQALASGDVIAGQKIAVIANLTDSIFEVVNDLSGVTLGGAETLTNKTLIEPTITSPDIDQVVDSSGNEAHIFAEVASAVNEITETNAASGNKPSLTQTGADDVGIDVDGVELYNGNIAINGAAGVFRTLSFRTSTIPRFIALLDTSAESGSNAGSDFNLGRYNDAGALIATTFSIVRSTGLALFENLSPASLVTGSTAGAVGTYAWLGETTTVATATNGTRAGSSLRYGGVLSAASYTNDFPAATSFIGNGGTPSGTWRCMGRAHNSGTDYPATLWVRIS